MSDNKNQTKLMMGSLQGLTSFDDIEAQVQMVNTQKEIEMLLNTFKVLSDNIMVSNAPIIDEDGATIDKRTALENLTTEFTTRLAEISAMAEKENYVIEATQVEDEEVEAVITEELDVVKEDDDDEALAEMPEAVAEATVAVGVEETAVVETPPHWFQKFTEELIARFTPTTVVNIVEADVMDENADTKTEEVDVELDEAPETLPTESVIAEVESAEEVKTEEVETETEAEVEVTTQEEVVIEAPQAVIEDVILETIATDEVETLLDENYNPYSGFQIIREKNGTDYRWLGWATNKFEDRDEEFLVDEAHKEFEQWLDDNPTKAPQLWIWHIPGTARKHRADWWAYTNGFFLYSGRLTSEEAKSYLNDENVLEHGPLGMSHGFLVLERDGNRILKYRTFEVSELPLKNAANPYTDFSALMSEEHIMKEFTNEQRHFLTTRLGDVLVAEIEDSTAKREKLLIERDVAWKAYRQDATVNESEAKVETPAVAEAEVVAEEAPTPPDLAVNVIEEVVQEVIKALNIPALQVVIEQLQAKTAQIDAVLTEVTELKARIQKVEKTDDEKIAGILSTPKPLNWFAASQATETVIEPAKNEELIKQAEAVNGTAPRNANSWITDTQGFKFGGDK